MARIRSIKPEFWSDGKNRKMSDSCALFYIALWNFADDEGKLRNDPLEISNLVVRWKQEKVKLWLSCLIKSGQLRVSSCSAWVQLTKWYHQRINRPCQPRVKASQLQWVTKDDSVRAHGAITEDSLTDRIMDHGSDHGSTKITEPKKSCGDLDTKKISSRSSGAVSKNREARSSNKQVENRASASRSAPEKLKADSKKIKLNGSVAKFIGVYVDAYRIRYGKKAKPHIDGRVRGRMQQFLRDTPLDRACDMIQVYLQMDTTWFAVKAHDFEAFMQNLTKVGTSLDTGKEAGKKKSAVDAWKEKYANSRARA